MHHENQRIERRYAAMSLDMLSSKVLELESASSSEALVAWGKISHSRSEVNMCEGYDKDLFCLLNM
jgi:hypothetical protein